MNDTVKLRILKQTECRYRAVVASIVAFEVYLMLRGASWAVEVIVKRIELFPKVMAKSVWAR